MALVYQFLIPAFWFVWIFYWIASAANTKRVARRESTLSRLSHGLPLWAGIILLTLPQHRATGLFASVWPWSEIIFWLGFLLMLAGFAVTVWARLALGRNWSATVTIKENHELIQNGPYRWVRHPIYTGLLLAFFGSALALDEWRGALTVVLVAIAFQIKLAIEERWMTHRFGPNYEAYRKRTQKLIPFVW